MINILTYSYVNTHTNVHRGKLTARADTFNAHTCNLIHVGAHRVALVHACMRTHTFIHM